MMEEMEAAAKTLRQNAEVVESQSLEALNNIYAEKRRARKQYMEDYNKIVSQFSQLMEEVSRKKTEYQKYLELYKLMRSRFEEHYVKAGRGGRKLDEVRDKFQKACRRLHATHNEYVLLLAAAAEAERALRHLLLPAAGRRARAAHLALLPAWRHALRAAAPAPAPALQAALDALDDAGREYDEFAADPARSSPQGPATPTLSFDDSLVEDTSGKLLPNQLAVDNLTIEGLRARLQELEAGVRDNQELQHHLTAQLPSEPAARELVEVQCVERRLQRQLEMIRGALSELGCEELPSGCDLSLSVSVEAAFRQPPLPTSQPTVLPVIYAAALASPPAPQRRPVTTNDATDEPDHTPTESASDGPPPRPAIDAAPKLPAQPDADPDLGNTMEIDSLTVPTAAFLPERRDSLPSSDTEGRTRKQRSPKRRKRRRRTVSGQEETLQVEDDARPQNPLLLTKTSNAPHILAFRERRPTLRHGSPSLSRTRRRLRLCDGFQGGERRTSESTFALVRQQVRHHFATLLRKPFRRKSVPSSPAVSVRGLPPSAAGGGGGGGGRGGGGLRGERGHSEPADDKLVPSTQPGGRPLQEEEWFHGVLPRDEVVRLLTHEGDFLVRETVRHEESQVVLSVCWAGHHKHFIVQTTADGSFRFEGPAFPTVQELIQYQQQSQLPVTARSGAVLTRAVYRERWELNNDDVILVEQIGRGNFGDVHRGKLRKTGMEVAVKTCRMTVPEEHRRKFLQEGRILKQYNHPNIVRLIGICVQKQPIMIVMELVPGGSLLKFLRSHEDGLTQRQLLGMCRDTAAGMSYLESHNCIHRDLAARNCLIGQNNIVKISDFGMSREEEEYIVSDGMKQIPIKWTAPEALNFGKYTSLCDVWSYGILIWEIFSRGGVPYNGMSNSQAREKIDNGYRMPKPDGTPDEMYRLMLSCWEYKPEKRPHFDQILTVVETLYGAAR
ncbi:tyrosine-protein kinase Fer-like [Schistocerca piceifrons]|uniref:tyrosine-protein kinase Fer-like n=1 Tax=Schistocerca piceifrons TaxID=274613 RepID=UPI001F5EA90E|nr:tyrosine-protein kinase Fer-like [Schistocerca piceifrons]